jgi:hypothetical protein
LTSLEGSASSIGFIVLRRSKNASLVTKVALNVLTEWLKLISVTVLVGASFHLTNLVSVLLLAF